jgi:transmembrane sensor
MLGFQKGRAGFSLATPNTMMTPPSYAPRHVRKARRWVARLASSGCSQRDVRRLQSWLEKDPRHRAAFDRQRLFWQSLSQAREQVLAACPDVTAANARPTMIERYTLPALASIGAVVVLVFFLPYLLHGARTEYRAGVTPRALTLEDGTEVSLDAGTAIAVDYKIDERRIELLRGHAWFNVAHQAERPFRVTALGGRIEDVGTAFEVGLDGDQVSSAVSQGCIEVSATGRAGKGVRVSEGQQVSYRVGGPLSGVQPVAVERIAVWRQGEILVVGLSPRMAIAQIARYRSAPVWVVPGHDERRKITGIFQTGKPDQAIRAVADQAGLETVTLPGNALAIY